MLGHHSIQIMSIKHHKSDFGRNSPLTERKTSSANHLFTLKTVSDEVVCPALGCIGMGTTEALGTHWLDLHEAEKMLWLCPMPRCHMKPRSSGMLDIHLSLWHKASCPVARRLREEIPPLVDWVINRKKQFPGVARPQFVTLPALPHGALTFNVKDTVITEVANIFPKGNKQGPSSVPRAPAAETLASTPDDAKQPRQVSASVCSWYELAFQPPPQPHLTSIPLPPSPPPAVLPSPCSELPLNSHRRYHQPCHRHIQQRRQFQLHQVCFRHCQYRCRPHHQKYRHPCCNHCPVCHCQYHYHHQLPPNWCCHCPGHCRRHDHQPQLHCCHHHQPWHDQLWHQYRGNPLAHPPSPPRSLLKSAPAAVLGPMGKPDGLC